MFNSEKVWLGITPTGWTNDDMPTLGESISFEQCVSEMALAGFVGCSVGHKFPRDPEVLERELSLRGLRVSEPWASTYFTIRNGEEGTIRSFREQMAFIKRMGGTDVVVAELGGAVHQQPVYVIDSKPVFDDGQWNALVKGLDNLGRIAQEEGMRLCYHHHMGTGVMIREEVDRLMNETNAEVVHLLLDTGHIYWAGGDPLDLAKSYADRIKHVHLKDIRKDVLDRCMSERMSFLDSVVEGSFTVPGDGVIDFRPILQVLSDHQFGGWLMVEAEQDPMKAPPLEYAMKARKYLREITGL